MKITNSILVAGVAGTLVTGVQFNLPKPADTKFTPTTAITATADMSRTSIAGTGAALNMVDVKVHEITEQKKAEERMEQEAIEAQLREERQKELEEKQKKAESERIKNLVEESLGGEVNPRSETAIGASEENLYWLSHLIYAEVGGNDCSDKLQLWVGSVILNRIAHYKYPSDIKSVIFDPYPTLQYGCTRGDIYKEPDERALRNAKYLLENGSILPSNVLGQQNKVDSGWKHYGTINGVVFSSWGAAI